MDHRVFKAINQGSLQVSPPQSFVGEFNVSVNTPEGSQPFLFESGVTVDLLKAFPKTVLLQNNQLLNLIGDKLQLK
jgi:hypothetical protein